MLLMSVQTWWLLGIAVIWVSILSGDRALAQIRPDRTLPNNSMVTPNGSTFNITGGTQAGANLFHSFQEFSVPTGGTAFFNNALDIRNIISRVTGGNFSNIDGLIRTLGTANLILINPNGIVFGPNASLNVGGSFVASTANAIQFGNQGFFSATNPDASAPLLTINPSALFFNQSTIAAISNSSVAPAGIGPTGAEVTGLRVPDGQSLLLVGGDVNINGGSLRAYGGRVELAGLAAPGTVGLNVGQNILTLSIPEDVQRANVSLSNGAEVNVRAQDGGSIAINAQNVSLSGLSKLLAGIESGLGTQQSKAGDIDINATGETVLSDGSFIANTVEPNAVGQAGGINITTGGLTLSSGGALNTATYGQGNASNIIINASGKVSFDGTSSIAFSDVEKTGVGKGGDIRISADSLSVTNGAVLTADTSGKGDAGNIIIDARNNVSFDNGFASSAIFQNGVGKGGDIRISADSLSVTNGAVLVAGTLGQGDSGNVIIDARNNVSFDNSFALSAVDANSMDNGFAISSASGDIAGNGVGKGGDIRISADTLSLTNGAELYANTFGQGDAGNIEIDAKTFASVSGIHSSPLSVFGISSSGGYSSALFTSTDSNATGKGGNITVNTPLLRVSDGAVLNAQTATNRNGGNITLNVKQAEILNGGQLIAVSSGAGNAGKITVNATDQVIVDGSDSFAAAQSADRTFNTRVAKVGTAVAPVDASSGFFARSQGTGSAGDIEVNSPQIRLDNSAKFSADTTGGGGNIQLKTPLFILRRGSSITTNANGSQIKGGNINIDAQNGFIIAVPGENSKISANSANFQGGNVTINNIAGLFGIEQTTTPSNSTSDITATGATPELSGNIKINRSNVNQTLGLVKLPTAVADARKLLRNACEALAEGEENSFTVTGRGGIPPNPYDPLSADALWTDTRIPNITSHQSAEKPPAKPQPQAYAREIVPATGWVFSGTGFVTLISNAHVANSLTSTPTTCPQH